MMMNMGLSIYFADDVEKAQIFTNIVKAELNTVSDYSS